MPVSKVNTLPLPTLPCSADRPHPHRHLSAECCPLSLCLLGLQHKSSHKNKKKKKKEFITIVCPWFLTPCRCPVNTMKSHQETPNDAGNTCSQCCAVSLTVSLSVLDVLRQIPLCKTHSLLFSPMLPASFSNQKRGDLVEAHPTGSVLASTSW